MHNPICSNNIPNLYHPPCSGSNESCRGCLSHSPACADWPDLRLATYAQCGMGLGHCHVPKGGHPMSLLPSAQTPGGPRQAQLLSTGPSSVSQGSICWPFGGCHQQKGQCLHGAICSEYCPPMQTMVFCLTC